MAGKLHDRATGDADVSSSRRVSAARLLDQAQACAKVKMVSGQAIAEYRAIEFMPADCAGVTGKGLTG